MYVVEPGEQGQGIQIRKGDRFTIPAGWLKLSLDPRTSTGRFTRAGMAWFVASLLTGDLPQDQTNLPDLLDKYSKEADAVLESSEKLKGLDLEDDKDAEEALARLKEDRDSIEWWALWVGVISSDLKRRLAEGGSGEAILSALRLHAARSALVFKQSLEDYVWTGYQHAQLIYDIASATARTPAEAEAIQALRPLFANLSEDVLHAWVEAGVEIGPRIGVRDVDEPLLTALAKYHLGLFERNRREEELSRQGNSRIWQNRIAAASVGVAVAGLLVGVLKALGLL